MKKKSIFKNLILLFVCLLSFSALADDMCVVDGQYEHGDNTYNVDSNGNATLISVDGDEDADDKEDDDDLNNGIDWDDIGQDDENSNSEGRWYDEDELNRGNNRKGRSREGLIFDEKLNTELSDIVVPFSQLPVINRGDGSQLDLFGICFVPEAYFFKGMKQYLGNTDLLNKFYTWLERAKYDTLNLRNIIDILKEVLGVISGTLDGNDNIIIDPDVISSIQARKIMTATARIMSISELILYAAGIILIVYGFLLVVSWVFDRSLLPLMSDTGLMENGLLGLISFNHLRADDDDMDKKSITFAKVAILGAASILIGRLIMTKAFAEIVAKLIAGCIGIFIK